MALETLSPGTGAPLGANRVAHSLVQAMADAAILLDPDLNPVIYNRGFAEATRLRPRKLEAELVRRSSVFELLGNTERTDARHAQEALKSGLPTHLGEMEVVNSAGERFVMLQSFLPVADDSGQTVAVVAVFRDQSDEARVHLRYKELLRLEQARAEELEKRVAERTHQLSEALEEVTRLSTYDPLTKLYNRRAFDEKARRAWVLAESEGTPVALMICDLDHFKRVNDQHGHQAGDKVLVAVAEALAASVRPTDVVARFGGEEFVVLLGGSAAATGVLTVAERCANAVRALPIPELIPGASRRQTVSIGVATYSRDCASLDQLIANADQALYEAKRSGRDRVMLFGGKALPVTATAENAKPRLLLVDPDEERAERTIERLRDRYAVISSVSGVEALRCCAREPFDVIVSEEDAGTESGVSFLRKSFAFAPFTARVLIIGSVDAFLAIRATNVGRVDHLLLREDCESHLVDALEHARLKLDLVGQKRMGAERDKPLVPTPKLEGLQAIMRSRRLRFAYQPLVGSDDGKTFGFEALARPDASGFCTPRPNPLALMEVAERMGAQWEVGRIGRGSIAKELDLLPRHLPVFINLHPTELANELLLEEEGMVRNAERVIFEITERAAIHDAVRCVSQISRLREVGFRLAIDDVGGGYAGLQAVTKLGADFIKVDMSLTRAIDRWQIKQQLMSSVVQFARQEGVRVVAEGVETEQESKTIASLGCDLQQGFHHGRPRELSYWRTNGYR